MKNTNGNLPAMPCSELLGNHGLTKREMFAIEFAAAMVSNPQLDATIPAIGVAKMAVEHAEALLAELERTA